MKKRIISQVFQWKNTEDASTAPDFAMEAKIDAEVYFRRCMKQKVILYDLKDGDSKEIKFMRRNEKYFASE